MAYKYPIDRLYGSVSWSLSDALLTYCPPANSAAEIQQKCFTISALLCYLRGPRWQMSLCYVSCSTLCLNNLFILNLFYITGVYTTVSKKKMEPPGEFNPYKFYFSAKRLKLLVMPFILLSTKITSKIIIYHKNKINEKKSVLQTAAIQVQLSTSANILFLPPVSY